MTPTAPEIRDLPSPNHGPRRPGAAIDMLVLHYTGMRTAGAALDRLRDPAAKVSAHYLVDEAGAVFRLVPEERRAWHAGRAFWAGETDVNGRSIGIELANPGHRHGYRPFPEAQMAALEALCRDILSRRAVPAGRVLGHSDVAPGRKSDPGELFDWRRLARAGIGFWPEIEPPPAGFEAGPVAAMRRGLARLGYAVAPGGGDMDAEATAALLAFQRRWLPANLTGAWDPPTAFRLAQVAAASA